MPENDKLTRLLHSPLAWGIVAVTVAVCMTFVLTMTFRPDYRTVQLEMSELASNIRESYRQKADYWGLNTETVLQNKSAPKSMQRQNRIVSSLGRDVTIGSNQNGDMPMPGARVFVLTVKRLSPSVCLGLAQSVDTKADPALEGIIIGNDSGSVEFGWNGSETFDSLPTQAQKLCKNNNTFSWIFR